MNKIPLAEGFYVLETFCGIALALHFPRAPNAFCRFARLLFRWLFIIPPQLHFAKAALALHFLFQNAQRLLNIIVMNNDGNDGTPLLSGVFW